MIDVSVALTLRIELSHFVLPRSDGVEIEELTCALPRFTVHVSVVRVPITDEIFTARPTEEAPAHARNFVAA